MTEAEYLTARIELLEGTLGGLMGILSKALPEWLEYLQEHTLDAEMKLLQIERKSEKDVEELMKQQSKGLDSLTTMLEDVLSLKIAPQPGCDCDNCRAAAAGLPPVNATKH